MTFQTVKVETNLLLHLFNWKVKFLRVLTPLGFESLKLRDLSPHFWPVIFAKPLCFQPWPFELKKLLNTTLKESLCKHTSVEKIKWNVEITFSRSGPVHTLRIPIALFLYENWLQTIMMVYSSWRDYPARLSCHLWILCLIFYRLKVYSYVSSGLYSH